MKKAVKNKKVIAVIAIGLMAILLAASGVIAGPPAGTGDPPVEAKINYQGQLTDSEGNPLSGTYDMEFLFYDSVSGGNQVGSTISETDVEVSNGLFNVKLDVDQSDFNGQGLWLEVKVKGETLSPRQEILPVPYALSLKPGAVIGGAGAGDGRIYLKDANDETVFYMSARDGGLVIGGPGEDGDIWVKNAADDNTFIVDGETGDVDYDGALTGAFPHPAYDSGWVSISQGEINTLTHNVGGNAFNYVVDLQFKNTYHGVNQIYYGGIEYGGSKGAYWYSLTSTTIKVLRRSDDAYADQIRVRIWVYK